MYNYLTAEYGVIYDYNQMLEGKRKMLYVPEKVSTQKAKEEMFSAIISYALKNILKWSARDAQERYNDKIAAEYKIDKAYKLIEYNPKLYYPISYILRYAYPEEIEYDFYKDTVARYQEVLAGAPYPKKFFEGDIGKARANLLLYINLDKDFFDDYSINALYHYFCDEKKAAKYIRKIKLYEPLKRIYGYRTIDGVTKYYFLDALPYHLREAIKLDESDKLES